MGYRYFGEPGKWGAMGLRRPRKQAKGEETAEEKSAEVVDRKPHVHIFQQLNVAEYGAHGGEVRCRI